MHLVRFSSFMDMNLFLSNQLQGIVYVLFAVLETFVLLYLRHVVCVSGKCSQWIKRSGWPVFPSLIAFFSYIAGDYSPQSLLEMIALHLDAVFVEHDTWREFALCFLKVSRCEEDEMSVCLHGNEGEKRQSYSFYYNGIPKMFTHGKSVGLWRSRCRWWSTRHFSKSILASEIDVGTYLSSL